MSRKFSRCIEDFECENCGTPIKGNGYTNHCPKCFFSKHVDINPGDRAANCGGMMEPIGIESIGNGFIIIFRCQKCGQKKKNKSSTKDDMEKIIEISKYVY